MIIYLYKLYKTQKVLSKFHSQNIMFRINDALQLHTIDIL